MHSIRLKLKAIHASLREFALRYLLFSMASSIALISVMIAHYAAVYNQQYNGSLIKVSVDYGVLTVNGVKVPFYVINAAYASLYGFHVNGNECIILSEALWGLSNKVTQLLECTLVKEYSYSYPVIIKFTNSSSIGNGTLIIPQDPSEYFTARLLGGLAGYTSLVYMAFTVIIALSSIYISLNYLNYLTDAFKRLRLIIGEGSIMAVTYVPLLTIASYLIIMVAEYELIKHLLSMEKVIRVNLSNPTVMLIEPLAVILIPVLITLVVSWRRSSR